MRRLWSQQLFTSHPRRSACFADYPRLCGRLSRDALYVFFTDAWLTRSQWCYKRSPLRCLHKHLRRSKSFLETSTPRSYDCQCRTSSEKTCIGR